MYIAIWICLTSVSACLLIDQATQSRDQEKQLLPDRSYDYSNVKLPNRTVGLLYPRESETREVRSLDGIWHLLRSNASDPDQGLREKWYKEALKKTQYDIIQMSVPASYNDVTVDQQLRDHVGTVWYERHFYVPSYWRANGLRTWLRFGSVHYQAHVWINGQLAMQHSVGHLPFEAEIGSFVNYGRENRITIMVDNRLGNHTIPQGQVLKEADDEGVTYVQTHTFDFFNYAGIHRSVHLYTTPRTYIIDIELKTQLTSRHIGRIDYRLWVGNGAQTDGEPNYVSVQLRDNLDAVVLHQINHNSRNGSLVVTNVKPWWPYLMHAQPGYLYTLEFQLISEAGGVLDSYRLPVGIRSLSWNNDSLYLNGKPLYLRGFGKHEDSDVSFKREIKVEVRLSYNSKLSHRFVARVLTMRCCCATSAF